MKILANDGISDDAKKKFIATGFTIETEKIDQDDLINYINNNNIDALIVRSATEVRKPLIDACPNLKLIGRAGVGLDNIDVVAAKEKNIKVVNTPGASSQAVAELVFSHLLGLCRFLHQSNKSMPLEGDKKFNELKKLYGKGIELRGRTIGIFGMGRIGRDVANIALGLDMKIIMHDHLTTNISLEKTFYDGQKISFEIPSSSKEDLLKHSDFVTIHVPAQDKYIIDRDELNLMKKGSILINLARGGVVNEEALLESLDKDHLGFAALDVFEEEPTPNIKLLMHNKLSLSPHIGGATVAAQDRIANELSDTIIEALKN